MRFDTAALHAGYSPEPTTHSRAVPIYATTAYTFDSTEHARQLFALEEPGNIYSRLSNPTCDILEARIAALEGGVGALAAASGHAAIHMTVMNLAGEGDEIVAGNNLYGGTMNMFGKSLARLGIRVNFVDAHRPEAFEEAITDKTKALYVEAVGNPNADLADIEAIAGIAHAHGVPLIVDNTVPSPALLRPKEFGADLIIHSTTKFLSGTGTVMGGMTVDCGTFRWKDNPRFPLLNDPDPSYHGVVFADVPNNAGFIARQRALILRDYGGCQSPFNAWVTLLGVETLGLRMKKHSENALAVAKFLEASDAVEQVNYPALPSSPYYELSKKYLPSGASSMFTFIIKGGREAGGRFINACKLISHVTNLGDARSLVSHPATTTHSQLSDEQLYAAGIAPGTVRLAIGLEDIEDLYEDLAQALAESQK
ncbi:MAG: O-acetylhomoserine aminocarboxypropyltransferase/cysteine synthase family protein [Eubacteriales bacterium]|nr:O-acetylhomoserine aminocarboxypropyltransferase/cysteine synthase family protein [Eubacteriales bacterium]MDY3285933.1 O-acetylhomoserine aminocarboxypropyltransferase/cysteine synthase family protein [Eubacteriales bacterium]